MKKLLFIVTVISLSSCSKDSSTKPQPTNLAFTKTSILPSYVDANISILNFQAKMQNKKVEINFTTEYASHVKTFEILRGFTIANFCSIYKQDASNVRNVVYKTTDEESGNSNIFYYMVRYTMDNGNWAYTPVIVLK